MATPYDKLYANLLPKFRDYDLPIMSEEEVKEYLQDYILTATTLFHTCRKNLSDRDDEAQCFNEDLDDTEIEIISNNMVIAYVKANYIITPTLLKVNSSSADFNAFSNANHLNKLLELYNALDFENQTRLARYSWSDANSVVSKLAAKYNKGN